MRLIGNGKRRQWREGKATYLASQPGNCPDCRQSCLRLCLCCCHCCCCSSCTEYFCILCVVSRAIFFFFLSYSLPILSPPPFFVYFKFLFPLHFLCVSFARFSLTGGLTMKEESCTVLTLYYPRQKKLTTCHSLPSLPTVLHSLGIEQLAT